MFVRWIVVAITATVLSAGSARAGQVLYVDDDQADGFNCSDAPYQRISDAVAVAKNGDEIRVCPGEYDEQLVITKSISLIGENFGTRRAIIKPTSLPGTLQSLASGNPVAAAVLVSAPVFRMADIDVDLANNTVQACTPVLTGLYLRNSIGRLERIAVSNARLASRPDCDSGVGILIESGPTDFVLGEPVNGRSNFSLRWITVDGYQKAGIVGLGPKTVLKIFESHATYGAAPTAGAVPNGFEISFDARAKIVGSTANDNLTSVAGKLGAGILAYQPGKTKFRLDEIDGNQVGIFVVGDRSRIKRGTITNQMSDGIVLLGDANVVSATEIQHSSVSGCFVNGDRNVLRGSYINDTQYGFWTIAGFGNQYFGVKFENVVLATRGVYDGVRDLTEADAAPFNPACSAALACDDGDACTTDTCTVETGACSHTAIVPCP
jgi:hypothetical protein